MVQHYKYTVCIHCMTYNHEKYLTDALEGFVMQKTNFPFVAVVIDDFSTDGTADILRKYEAKYPDIIKAVYLQENYYSQRKPKKPFLDPYDSQSKYIALCEGDDYWTDPLKLQKQVDFLESHPDYSMCCHGATVLNETTRVVDTACERMTTREYFPEDAFPKWQIPTASIMYRRELVMAYPIVRTQDFTAGDVVLILRCMHVGRVWGFEDKMSVYRMNAGGLTSVKPTFDSMLKTCKHYEALMINFSKLDKDYCLRFISMVYYTKFRHEKRFADLWKALTAYPSYVIRKIMHLPPKRRNDLFYQYYGC